MHKYKVGQHVIISLIDLHSDKIDGINIVPEMRNHNGRMLSIKDIPNNYKNVYHVSDGYYYPECCLKPPVQFK